MKTSLCDAETHAQSECNNLGHCAGDNKVCGFSFCSKKNPLKWSGGPMMALPDISACAGLFQFKTLETEFGEAKSWRLKNIK